MDYPQTARLVHRFRSLLPEVQAAVIVSAEGEVAVRSVTRDADRFLAPILAALATVAERACQESGRGPLEQVLVRGPRGMLIAQELGGGWTMGVVTPPDGRLGLILDDLQALSGRLFTTLAQEAA